MPTNLIVKVNERIALKLKQRAAKNHRSVEAEHLEILKETLIETKIETTPETNRRPFLDVLQNMPNLGEDSDFNCRVAARVPSASS
jgi:antitoxin FitA